MAGRRNALNTTLTANGSTSVIRLAGRFDFSLEDDSADGTITLERSMVDPAIDTADWRVVSTYTASAEETGECVEAFYRVTVASMTTGTWRIFLSDGRFIPS